MNYMFLVLLFAILSTGFSARILGIFPSCGYSQFILALRLMTELAGRGHHVTVISAFSSKTAIENYQQISIPSLAGACKSQDLFDLESYGAISGIISVNEYGLYLTEHILENKEVQELLNSGQKFDLILCEQFFNDAHRGFAYHFKTPLVLLSSIGPSEWTNNFVGNPSPYSYIPSSFADFSFNMDIVQRMKNILFGVFFEIYYQAIIYWKHDNLLHKYFPKAPPLRQLLYNVDLVLYNSHLSSNAPVPTVPSMVEIGGFHVDPKPLPTDLQKYLDNSREGVIYFSMGSNLNSTNFPKNIRDSLMKAFSKLKENVLWKWETEDFPEKPANIKTGKWLPQQGILGHPNVKVFISHCGLLSTIESVYHGVPMIGIPIFGDQKFNSAISRAHGFSLTVPYNEITEEKISWALNETLNNKKYRENAKLRSRFMHDRPMKPIDEAMYWIEYVIRHKGAEHLRVHGLKLPWYKYYNLDVAAFISLPIFLCALINRFMNKKV